MEGTVSFYNHVCQNRLYYVSFVFLRTRVLLYLDTCVLCLDTLSRGAFDKLSQGRVLGVAEDLSIKVYSR